MSAWTRILRMRTIINGRLVMIETKQACYYRYIIFPNRDRDFSLKNSSKIIYSDWIYLSGVGAFSAGKAAARKLPEITS